MSTQRPVLIRIEEASAGIPPSIQAGFRARIARRVWDDEDAPSLARQFKWLRIALLILGLGGLGYYGYTLADEHVYQAYQNWAFEQQIAGQPAVTFSDYLHATTAWSGTKARAVPAPTNAGSMPVSPHPVAFVRPVVGSLLGRLEIPRLSLSAVVREGSDAAILSTAVGHVPSTAMAGQSGNFAIAAHRDTLFRGLRDIKEGDLVQFQTASETYRYQVFSTRVVKPSEVSVLRPDAGLPEGGEPHSLLTMITCYPFSYVGSAPERFIVTARRIDSATEPARPLGQIIASKTAARPPSFAPRRHTASQSTNAWKGRGSSRPGTRIAVQIRSTPAPKHRSFWHKLLRSN